MATIVNVIGSSENSKNNNGELQNFLCLRAINLKKKSQCFSDLQCYSVGVVTYFGLRA